jgi:histidinol dehydrogenase
MQIVHWERLTKQEKAEVLSRQGLGEEASSVKDRVAEVIRTVRSQGDQALHHYTKLFDGVELTSLQISDVEWQSAFELETHFQKAIQIAYDNIQRFHRLQIPKPVSLDADGIRASKVYKPLEAVGLYIPGGSAPLVSTLLMLAIPAQLAGCAKIVLCTPPDKQGLINRAILFAAQLCGVKNLFKIGGAQAVAAMAYGTPSVPKVDKIFGPGNRYVTEAKIQVSQSPEGAALDSPAGPSEVLIIADYLADPEFVAADLLAQAEHDPDAKSILVTTSAELASQVASQLVLQTKDLSRQAIVQAALENCALIITPDLATCFAISNTFAPEHLLLQIDDPHAYLDLIQNAGSVFIGPWSSEALGDYASGPNHVLPTYGYAKNYSGLGVESFMKSITFQEVSASGCRQLAPTVEALATLEGLDAHRHSVRVRRKRLEGMPLD